MFLAQNEKGVEEEEQEEGEDNSKIILLSIYCVIYSIHKM